MNMNTYICLSVVFYNVVIGNSANEVEMKQNTAGKSKINITLQKVERNYSDNITYDCSRNEVFKLCESCNESCENGTNVCTEPWGGCFCDKKSTEDKYNQCFKYEECSRLKRNDFPVTELPLPYELSCGAHQVYSSCRRCDKTCSDPNPPCNSSCIAGCFCDDGYLKAPDGQCILLKNCPQAVITIGSNEPSIDECLPDEVFVWCGWCEGSCSEPTPQCPETTCTQGCLCRPPLLRHYSGLCVEEKDCLPRKCPYSNEEYTCHYGCEARCNAHACTRPRRCHLGCHCKRGLFRNEKGKCVPANECSKQNN
nr:SCO-spondin-like [Vanessa tameamea]